MSAITLVGGGVRSGKSAFALARALRVGPRRAFVATAIPFDPELRERVAAHRAERGTAFTTIEEPLDLAGALARVEADVVLVDCLTLWLSNLVLRGDPADRVAAAVEGVVAELERRRFAAVLVTNEVGMGVVPESALGRHFRDVAGRAHQRLARAADQIYLAALGCVLRLRPAPVELVAPEPP